MNRRLVHPLRSTRGEENRLFTAENPAEPRVPAEARPGSGGHCGFCLAERQRWTILRFAGSRGKAGAEVDRRMYIGYHHGAEKI